MPGWLSECHQTAAASVKSVFKLWGDNLASEGNCLANLLVWPSARTRTRSKCHIFEHVHHV